MLRSKVAPPGTRLPLLVLALALALGAVMIVRVHRAITGPAGSRSIAASPRAAPAAARHQHAVR